MTRSSGRSFKAAIMQWGAIPPSGGPYRERYLDYHGNTSLNEADDAYREVMALLGDRASDMPLLPVPLVESSDSVRRQVQTEKQTEWISFRGSLDQSVIQEIKPHIARSVSASMAALNYLEDRPLRETAHKAIHRAAFVKRGLFGCPIVLRDDEFWTDCPINLSHLRMGVSAGLVGDFECSICGELVEDCDHQMGQAYQKVAERDAEGACTLCEALNCEHTEGETFLVEAYANALGFTANEVSLVARPRYPQARITERTIDLETLGDDPRIREFAKHGALSCDADLGPCVGFNDMLNWKPFNPTVP